MTLSARLTHPNSRIRIEARKQEALHRQLAEELGKPWWVRVWP